MVIPEKKNVSLYPTTQTTSAAVTSLPVNTGYGQISSIQLQSNTRTNLIKSSNMNTDSNTDGKVDDFSSSNSIGATFALNDNAQKISIVNCATNNAFARVMQGNLGDAIVLPCTSGDVMSARVECKFIKTTGSPFAYFQLAFRDSAGNTVAGGGFVTSNITTSTSGYTELKIENKTAPANTTYAEILCILQTSPTASTNPETADVWFKNAMLEKASAVGNYISTGTKSTDCDTLVQSIGKNLFDGKLELGSISGSTGVKTVSTAHLRSVNYTKVKPNTQYTVKNFSYSVEMVVYEYDVNKNFITASWGTPKTFTTTVNTVYVYFGFAGTDINSNIQLEYGSIATAYEPYQESTAIYPAPGKRVGNVADETTDKEHIQRNSDTYTLQSADIIGVTDLTNVTVAYTKDFTDIRLATDNIDGFIRFDNKVEIAVGNRDNVANIGTFYTASGNPRKMWFVVTKGTTLVQAQSLLAGQACSYHLLNEIRTPIEITYTLNGQPADMLYCWPGGTLIQELTDPVNNVPAAVSFKTPVVVHTDIKGINPKTRSWRGVM